MASWKLLFALTVSAVTLAWLVPQAAQAQGRRGIFSPVTDIDAQRGACNRVPSYEDLTRILKLAVSEDNGGFEFNMWATVVNRDGVVCAVTFSGSDRGDQWPGSRAIAAQKANTANAFSLDNGGDNAALPAGLALSTANLFTAVQPGGSLFGLQESNPVDVGIAYRGSAVDYGQKNDPMVGGKIGGVNVFGGGLALYDQNGHLVGGLGVSGDTSCADHNIAWKVRDYLVLDYVPAGPNPETANGTDNIIYDDTGTNGFAHPDCGNGERAIAEMFPTTHPVSTVAP